MMIKGLWYFRKYIYKGSCLQTRNGSLMQLRLELQSDTVNISAWKLVFFIKCLNTETSLGEWFEMHLNYCLHCFFSWLPWYKAQLKDACLYTATCSKCWGPEIRSCWCRTMNNEWQAGALRCMCDTTYLAVPWSAFISLLQERHSGMGSCGTGLVRGALCSSYWEKNQLKWGFSPNSQARLGRGSCHREGMEHWLQTAAWAFMGGTPESFSVEWHGFMGSIEKQNGHEDARPKGL